LHAGLSDPGVHEEGGTRFVNGALSALAGILTGLSLGYVLWGAPTADLSGALAKTSAELEKTKAWLFDEIQNSDQQHKQLSSRLSQALADLAKARAELARTTQTAGSTGTLRAHQATELPEPARPGPGSGAGGPQPGEISDPARR
jgi:hypothetical protein